MKWQPIETAPDNGEEILVAFRGQFKWVYFVAIALGSATTTQGYAEPTHWSPIAPPDEKK